MFFAIVFLVLGIMVLASANIIWIKEKKKNNVNQGVLQLAKRMQIIAYVIFAIAILLTF